MAQTKRPRRVESRNFTQHIGCGSLQVIGFYVYCTSCMQRSIPSFTQPVGSHKTYENSLRQHDWQQDEHDRWYCPACIAKSNPKE